MQKKEHAYAARIVVNMRMRTVGNNHMQTPPNPTLLIEPHISAAGYQF